MFRKEGKVNIEKVFMINSFLSLFMEQGDNEKILK